MCGRYNLNLNQDFYNRFGVVNQLQSFPKNSQVSPGQIEPVIIKQEGLTLVWTMKWGLIPFWAKDRGVGNKMFNIRSESLSTKIGFRKSFTSKRCLVPSNGFYEWKTEKGIKVPYFIEVQDRPLFAFAGIYDLWEEPVSGREVYSFAIITTQPNLAIKPLHDRMPVILRPEQEKVWLDHSILTSKLDPLLRPSSENLTIKTTKI
jgi:putative SOS response-associated peptidase YedK